MTPPSPTPILDVGWWVRLCSNVMKCNRRLRGFAAAAALGMAGLATACVGDPTSLGGPLGSGAWGTTGDPQAGDSQADQPSGSGSVMTTGADDADSTANPTTFNPPPSDTGDDADSGGTTHGIEPLPATTGGPTDASEILFINFDGVTLVPGKYDNASNDQAALAVSMDTPLAPYGNGPKRQLVMAQLEDHWAPLGVMVTDTRPQYGAYAMVVVTPTNPLPNGNVWGLASQDCDDANPRSVGIAVAGPGDGRSADATAVLVSHMAGHGYGLDHVDADDIMNVQALAGRTFVDACLPVLGETMCQGHGVACPAGQQNSAAELAARFDP